MPKAQLIIIGNEILNGRTLDRNGHYLAERLNDNGITVNKIVTIEDEPEAIKNAFNNALGFADIIISTGGLGPTKDDITKSVLAEIFDCPIEYNGEAMASIKAFLENRGRELKGLNKDQAYIPGCAKPLPNKSGTAPGLLFEQNQQVVAAFPGVPSEMQYLTNYQLLPYLKDHFTTEAIHHKQVLTIGIPEAILAQKIGDLEEDLPEGMKLAYLPDWGIVKLRLSAKGTDEATFNAHAEQFIEAVRKRIGPHIFGFDDDQLSEVIGEYLQKANATLANAESCTGGYLSHLITGIPGSSAYFTGGLITYTNALKKQLLSVPEAILTNEGAVSKGTVEAMVKGTLKTVQSDYAIAISGVAGPSGGTQEKPVGTVWIAVGNNEQVISQKFQFFNERQKNIHFSAVMALDMLRQLLVFGELSYEYP